jgi:hypothetical protein
MLSGTFGLAGLLGGNAGLWIELLVWVSWLSVTVVD